MAAGRIEPRHCCTSALKFLGTLVDLPLRVPVGLLAFHIPA